MNNIFCAVVGAIVGGVAVFVALHVAPSVCRGVVLKDMTESVAYTQELSKAMPADTRDFLTTLTAGKK